MDWLLRGGHVVDPHTQTDAILDLRIREGRIAEIGRDLTPDGGEMVVDATGLLVTPGLIDLHVHLRDPGQTHKESIESGARAAAAGGFIGVACMANTSPTLDAPERIRYVLEKADRVGLVDVHPLGSLTIGLKGQKASPYGSLREAGAVAFSDDGASVMDATIMREALRQSTASGALVVVHCEDPNLSKDGVMNAGPTAERLRLPGIPPEAEESIIARDLSLAAETDGHLHIQHVTTARGVRLIREAKARGVRVTAEATPHHFTLTDEAVAMHGTNAKMNPPLRTKTDLDAIIDGLIDGTLDAIATDHAPHHPNEKARGMLHAPFGIIGLELCVPLTWTRLVEPGHLTPIDAIRKLTVAPASILGLPVPRLEVGAPANVTVIDITQTREVTPECIFSKSRNTPFFGARLRGWPVWTIRQGRETFRRNDETRSNG